MNTIGPDVIQIRATVESWDRQRVRHFTRIKLKQLGLLFGLLGIENNVLSQNNHHPGQVNLELFGGGKWFQSWKSILNPLLMSTILTIKKSMKHCFGNPIAKSNALRLCSASSQENWAESSACPCPTQMHFKNVASPRQLAQLFL